jgi:hypothetical protein
MTSSGHTYGDHTGCDPDGCFAAKCAYWRENGGLTVSYQGGRDFFHDRTIPERQRLIKARAKANGWEARVKNPLYDK